MTNTVTSTAAPGSPANLAGLLAELAALPAGQRAALAALLAPSSAFAGNSPSPLPLPSHSLAEDAKDGDA